MKKFAKILAVALVGVMALAIFVACAPSSDPQKAADALTKNDYLVDYAIAANGLTEKASCDAVGLLYKVESGKLIAYVSAKRGTSDSGNSIIILYFADSATANSVWENSFFTNLRESKKNGEADKDAVVKKSGKMIYFGTKQAVKDAR